MQFKKDVGVYGYEVERTEGGVNTMYVNYLGADFVPSIAENAAVMMRTIDNLIKSPNVSRIVFVQQRNYSHSFKETNYLIQIAQLFVHLSQQEKILSLSRLSSTNQSEVAQRHSHLSYLLILLKQDPIACYNLLENSIADQHVMVGRSPENSKVYELNYLSILEKFKNLLGDTDLLKEAMKFMDSPAIVKQMEKKDFNARIIAHPKYKDHPVTKYKGIYYKYLNVQSEATTTIFKDYVAIHLILGKPIIILIKNKHIAESYKNHFEVLWKVASKK